MEERCFAVPEKTLNAIAEYLLDRPMREVQHLVESIHVLRPVVIHE